MKPHKLTQNQIFLDHLLTNNGFVEIDKATQRILMSLLLEYRIRQDYWIPILIAWYNKHPYASLMDTDIMALAEFKIHFKFFMLGQLQVFLDAGA